MNTTHSIPTPQRDPQRSAASWPVLARLTDVAPQLPATPPAAKTASQSRSLEYRFDPPQMAATQRTGRFDYARRAGRDKSRILPSSNPFSIPTSTLQQSLSPLVRFLMLVILFTAAGTIVLMSWAKKNQPVAPRVPQNAAARPALEPAATPLEAATTIPSAKGPGQTTSAGSLEPSAQSAALPGSVPLGATDIELSMPVVTDPSQTLPGTGSVGEYPSAPFTGATGWHLPQVQNFEPQSPASEPPQAVARLSGYVQEAPARQASNDNDQSGVY